MERSGSGRVGSGARGGDSRRFPISSVLPPPPPVPVQASAMARDSYQHVPHPPGLSEGGGGGYAASLGGVLGGAGGGGSRAWQRGGGTASPSSQTREPRYSLLDFRVDSDTLSHNARVPGLPGKTGTGAPVLGHHPSLARAGPVAAAPECLYSTNQELAVEMMSHDAERMARPLEVKNRVVFDSLDSPPDYAAAASTEPGDAAAAAAIVGPPAPSAFQAGPHAQLYKDGTLPPPFYTLEGDDDDTLVFESRFESGNLRRAIQVYDYEYDLILRPDINTRGHTQWFYFSVSNTLRNVPYKLNIINMVKSDSLYQDGMQPLICSEKESVATGRVWTRNGTNTSYYQNNIKRKNGHYYYTFTCTFTFPHANDTVYVAYCYPYTYTDLQRYLRRLEEDPKRRQRFRRRVLCQTLAGNNCDLLTITSFGGDPESLRHRRGVVVTGRVHPGESNASWMMKGTLDFLTGSSLDAKILRDNFVFKVVPMLNPDGVINGNYRCSLAGVDLNRVWTDPSKKLHPTIYHTKMMVRRLMDDRELVMFCDYHGHSRKKNVFMYGCERKADRKSQGNQPPIDKMTGSSVQGTRLLERVFPCALSQTAPNIFAYADCNFKVQKSKENTARVVLWREFNLINSFTLEASFAGPAMGAEVGLHYGIERLEEMGHAFCEAMLHYCDPDPTRMQQLLRDLELQNPPKNGYSNISSMQSADMTNSAPSGSNNNNSNPNSSAPNTVNNSEDSEEDDVDSDDSDDDSDYVAQSTARRKTSKKSKNTKKKSSSGSKGSLESKSSKGVGGVKSTKDRVDSGRSLWKAAGATLSSSAANPTREQVSSARSKSSKKLERTSSKGSQSSKLNGSARRLAGEEEATLDSDRSDAYDTGLAGMMDDMVLQGSSMGTQGLPPRPPPRGR